MTDFASLTHLFWECRSSIRCSTGGFLAQNVDIFSKTCLNFAISRIKLLRNKREVQLKKMRHEISQFLQTGQEAIARIRVEHIIREQNILAAYEILELFCEFVLARVPILETQRECPPELQEAVGTIIFASPRCSDLPELMQVRNLFTTKYGKEFVSAASELRPDSSVNRAVIEKLSVKAPSVNEKLKILKEIAKEYNVEWDSSSTEEEFMKKHEDLLDGVSQICHESADSQSRSAGSSRSLTPAAHGNIDRPTKQNLAVKHVQGSTLVAKAVAFNNAASSGGFDNRNEVRSIDYESQGNQKTEISSSSSSSNILERSRGNQKTEICSSSSSSSNNILERARAAIASAERASAAARAAAELARVRLGSQPQYSSVSSSGTAESGSFTNGRGSISGT